MLAQRITPNSDVCNVARRWGIELKLATMLSLATARVGGGGAIISIISGKRSPEEQIDLCDDLEGGDRPCASPATSRHVGCPATAADLRWDGATESDWRRLGEVFESLDPFGRARWGGRFGDPNHFDLG